MPKIPDKKSTAKRYKSINKNRDMAREYADRLSAVRLRLVALNEQLLSLSGEINSLYLMLYTEQLITPITENKEDVPF